MNGNKMIGAALGMIAAGAFIGYMKKYVNFPVATNFTGTIVDIIAYNPAPAPAASVLPPPLPPAPPAAPPEPTPTDLMPTNIVAAAQEALLGVNTAPTIWAVPGGNPNFVPAEVSDWAPLPGFLEGQVADYSSSTGGYIIYNGSKYWLNNRNLAPQNLWI